MLEVTECNQPPDELENKPSIGQWLVSKPRSSSDGVHKAFNTWRKAFCSEPYLVHAAEILGYGSQWPHHSPRDKPRHTNAPRGAKTFASACGMADGSFMATTSDEGSFVFFVFFLGGPAATAIERLTSARFFMYWAGC